MRVRIKQTPPEREMDGVALDRFAPGAVRTVSPSIGSWLIAEGYADSEMRHADRKDDQSFLSDEPRGSRIRGPRDTS